VSVLAANVVDALNSSSLTIMDSAQIGALIATQVAVLDSLQIQAISSDDFRAFTTNQAVALTSENIRGFTSLQLTVLDAEDFAWMHSAEFNRFTSSQLLGLSSGDIAALGASAHGGALTSTQLMTIFQDEIAAISQTIGSGFQSATEQQAKFGFVTPIVLDLNGDGIQTVNIADGVSFDVNNDGFVERSAWVLNSDGLLVRDINGDGVINNGGELFGSGTVLPDGSKAADGYIAMRALDTNMDGLLDANDQAFGELKVWRDANGDGKTDAGELLSLNQLNVTSISLNATVGTEVNNGNILGLMGSYTTADGKTHTMGDVWFQVDESGKQVFDLAAVAKAAGSANINLSKTDAHTLNVTLADVLAVGAPDILNGSTQVTITGDSGDTVQLDGGSGWSLAGTTTDGADTYMVYVNQNAHLLVNDKIHTIIV